MSDNSKFFKIELEESETVNNFFSKIVKNLNISRYFKHFMFKKVQQKQL